MRKRRLAFLHIMATSRLLDVLREDNRAIVRAASAASKAADYILGFQSETPEAGAAIAADDQREAA
jgi:antirestriction protein ArdC